MESFYDDCDAVTEASFAPNGNALYAGVLAVPADPHISPSVSYHTNPTSGAGGYQAQQHQVPQQQYYDGWGEELAVKDDGTSVQLPGTGAPLCKCNEPCARLQSSTARNPGRWFLKCAKFKDDSTQCKYFMWEDELLAGGIENNNMNNSQGGGPLTRKPRTEDYQPPIGAAAAYNALPDAAYNAPPDAAGRGAGDGYQPGFSMGVPVPSPNAGGAAPRDRSGDICFKCNQAGHWSSQCPSRNTASGGCFKCGGNDHWARDCPQKAGDDGPSGAKRKWEQGSSSYGAGGGGGGYGGGAGGYGGGSYRDAGGPGGRGYGPSFGGAGRGGGGRGGASTDAACFRCGESGHWSRDCPYNGKSQR